MDGQQPPSNPVERGRALIAAAIAAAALIIYWGLPDEPRYQLAGSGSAIVRLDTDSGEMIGCDMQRCARIMAPDRAKTIGALTIERGKPQRQLPPAANSE
jgi:hypothetical protein